MVKTWLVVPIGGTLLIPDAQPIAEALEVYREGKVHEAARVLSEAEAYIARTEDDDLAKAAEEAAWPDGRFFFRGNLNEVLTADRIARVDEAQLGILLEGDADEEGDLPLSVRRIPSEPREFYASYGRGNEVFAFYTYQDLLAYAPEEPLEAFPGLEGEKEEA